MERLIRHHLSRMDLWWTLEITGYHNIPNVMGQANKLLNLIIIAHYLVFIQQIRPERTYQKLCEKCAQCTQSRGNEVLYAATVARFISLECLNWYKSRTTKRSVIAAASLGISYQKVLFPCQHCHFKGIHLYSDEFIDWQWRAICMDDSGIIAFARLLAGLILAVLEPARRKCLLSCSAPSVRLGKQPPYCFPNSN